jgi:hypothetical protein
MASRVECAIDGFFWVSRTPTFHEMRGRVWAKPDHEYLGEFFKRSVRTAVEAVEGAWSEPFQFNPTNRKHDLVHRRYRILTYLGTCQIHDSPIYEKKADVSERDKNHLR